MWDECCRVRHILLGQFSQAFQDLQAGTVMQHLIVLSRVIFGQGSRSPGQRDQGVLSPLVSRLWHVVN